MKFKIIENSQNKVTQPVWNNGYWYSPSSVGGWIEENPKFNLFLQYYGIEEEFIRICRNKLYYYSLYEKFINKSEILTKMFVFLNNIKNNRDETPLFFACKNDNLEMVKLLLENGAQESINIKNGDNETPLFFACKNDNLEMVKILLDNGAQESINAKDGYHDTPLLCACRNNNLEMVKILLENGAKESINVKIIYSHQTPLYWAREHKNKEIIELLEKYSK